MNLPSPGALPHTLAQSARRVVGGIGRWWQAQRRAEQRRRDSEGLYQVAQAILAASGDLTPFMDAAEAVAKAMGYDHGAVFITKPGQPLGWVVGYGQFAAYAPWEAARSGAAVLHHVIATGQSFVAQGPSQAAHTGDFPVTGVCWQACLPLAIGDRARGVLIVARDRPQEDQEQALATATSLAAQIAIGIRNYYLYAEREALAAAAERNRLARDIHDGIAQSLYMLTLNLETCVELAGRGGETLQDRLRTSLQLSRNTLWETRQYLHDLQPLFSQAGKLAQALAGQIREFSTVSQISVDFTTAGEEGDLPPEVKAALYRITQEALANVYKHAQARRVAVSLSFDEGHIRLEIADDGVGFPGEDVTSSVGRGLRNIRQRMAEIGGQMYVQSAPGRGTRLTVTVGA